MLIALGVFRPGNSFSPRKKSKSRPYHVKLWSSYFKIRFLQIAHDCTLLKLVLNKRVGQISLEKRKSRVCAGVRKSQKPKILKKATIGCKRFMTDTGVAGGQLAR